MEGEFLNLLWSTLLWSSLALFFAVRWRSGCDLFSMPTILAVVSKQRSSTRNLHRIVYCYQYGESQACQDGIASLLRYFCINLG